MWNLLPNNSKSFQRKIHLEFKVNGGQTETTGLTDRARNHLTSCPQTVGAQKTRRSSALMLLQWFLDYCWHIWIFIYILLQVLVHAVMRSPKLNDEKWVSELHCPIWRYFTWVYPFSTLHFSSKSLKFTCIHLSESCLKQHGISL